MVLKQRPIPTPAKSATISLEAEGDHTQSGPPVFLVPFRKDPARMNGTPQPNQK